MKELAIKKLYYSISEVSEMTSLKPYVLRYWESEFSDLRPSKNRAGNRIYRRNDIQLILQIKKLLYEEKFTIEGARQKLKKLSNNRGGDANFEQKNQQTVKLIEDIRKELVEILSILGNN